MSKPNLIVDSFAVPTDVKWEINEFSQDKVVDGVNILGRVVGPMFAPGGNSLNGRHYTKSLWEKAIAKNKERLDNSEVLGTIGHEQTLTDQDLLEGKVSHKVTKLWIDEKTGAGMGEIHILGTNAGKALNALLRGGVRLKVSTRALGEFTNKKTPDGAQIIDEDTYDLQGIDFVQRPGIPSAIPVLVEKHEEPDLSTSSSITENPTNLSKDNTMSNDLLEALSRDKIKIQESLTDALTQNKSLTSESDALRRTVEDRQKEVARIEEQLTDSKKKITELESKLADVGNASKKYEELGSPETIKTKLDDLSKLVEAYNEFGTPSELTTAFEKVNLLIEEYKPLGSPAVISDIVEAAEKYADFGTVEEIEENIERLKTYEELTTPEQFQVISDLLTQYKNLGSPSDIQRAFALTEAMVRKFKDDNIKKDSAEIAEKFGIKSENVEALLVKNGKELTIKILEDIVKVKPTEEVTERYRLKDNKNKETILESTKVEENSTIDKPRGMKLLERFSRLNSDAADHE